MYADTVTEAMDNAIRETARRRNIQENYNKDHGIVPKTIHKAVRELLEITTTKDLDKITKKGKGKAENTEDLVKKLTRQMQQAAKNLDFEMAAVLRDKIRELTE